MMRYHVPRDMAIEFVISWLEEVDLPDKMIVHWRGITVKFETLEERRAYVWGMRTALEYVDDPLLESGEYKSRLLQGGDKEPKHA